jgi:uncharacterized protein (TIGR03067 family)
MDKITRRADGVYAGLPRLMVKITPAKIELGTEVASDAVPERYTVDPSTSPASIDLTNSLGKVTYGIYRFKAGKLEISYDAHYGSPRPTSFDCLMPEKGEAAIMFVVLRRMGEDFK